MSIEIELLDDEREAWNAAVEDSPHSSPLYRYGALETMAAYSGATLYPFAGYKGNEPVGILPFFEIAKGPISVLSSPPPDMKIPYMGPALLNVEKLKQRKTERRTRRFVEGCLERIRTEIDPQYTTMRVGYRYNDLRPFVDAGFESKQRYTHVVDLTPDLEDLKMAFSSDARSNMRECDDAGLTIEPCGAEGIEFIVESVRDRLAARGESYPVEASFVQELHRKLPEGIRPYVATVDGERVGGNILVTDGDRAYAWIGASTPSVDLPVNDALHWRMMRDAREAGVTEYDLCGANKLRLAKYKAKFDPELRTYHSVNDGGATMEIATSLYQKVR